MSPHEALHKAAGLIELLKPEDLVCVTVDRWGEIEIHLQPEPFLKEFSEVAEVTYECDERTHYMAYLGGVKHTCLVYKTEAAGMSCGQKEAAGTESA